MFDLVHMDDKTLSRGEYIETRDFNLLASSGLAENVSLLSSCATLPLCSLLTKQKRVLVLNAF